MSNDNAAPQTKPPEQDPADVAFWESRYRRGFAPWDQGKVQRQFLDLVRSMPPQRALVPGCGPGYEARVLADAGWDVTALDYSPAAIEMARATMGPYAHRVVQEDFFGERVGAMRFDCIVERAFFCALPTRLREQWPARTASLLEARGLLAGYFFVDEPAKGPPYPLPRETIVALLSPHFELLVDEDVDDSMELFKGRERWMMWRKR